MARIVTAKSVPRADAAALEDDGELLEVVSGIKGYLVQTLVDVLVDGAVEGSWREGLAADGAATTNNGRTYHSAIMDVDGDTTEPHCKLRRPGQSGPTVINGSRKAGGDSWTEAKRETRRDASGREGRTTAVAAELRRLRFAAAPAPAPAQLATVIGLSSWGPAASPIPSPQGFAAETAAVGTTEPRRRQLPRPLRLHVRPLSALLMMAHLQASHAPSASSRRAIKCRQGP